jgi:hypothetical protein
MSIRNAENKRLAATGSAEKKAESERKKWKQDTWEKRAEWTQKKRTNSWFSCS